MNQKQLVAGLMSKAKKYRTFRHMVGDRETAQRIFELTEELKQQAMAVASPNEEQIRKRARKGGCSWR